MDLITAAERLAVIDRSAVKFDSGRCLYGLDKFSTCAACTNLCPVGAIQPAAGPACTFCKHEPQENRESISNERLTD